MKSSTKRSKVHDIASLFGGMVKTKKCRSSVTSQHREHNHTNDIMRTIQRLKRIDKPSRVNNKESEPAFLKTMKKLKHIHNQQTKESIDNIDPRSIHESDVEPIDSTSSTSLSSNATNIEIEGCEGEIAIGTSQMLQSVTDNHATNECTENPLNASQRVAFTKGMEYVRQLLLKENTGKQQSKIKTPCESERSEQKEEEEENDANVKHEQSQPIEETPAQKAKATPLLIKRWADSIAEAYGSKNITRAKHRWLVHCLMGKFCEREKVKNKNGEYYFNKQSEIDLVNKYCDVFRHKKAKKQNKNRKRKHHS